MRADNDAKKDVIAVCDATIQRLPVALTLADGRADDMPIVCVNAAFVALSGYDPASIIGHNCRFLQADRENVQARGELREAIAQGRATQVILRNRRADGTDFDNLLAIVPFKGLDGAPHLIMGAQFALADHEVPSSLNTTHILEDDDLAQSLSRARALHLERRRLLIDASARTIQSTIISAQV